MPQAVDISQVMMKLTKPGRPKSKSRGGFDGRSNLTKPSSPMAPLPIPSPTPSSKFAWDSTCLGLIKPALNYTNTPMIDWLRRQGNPSIPLASENTAKPWVRLRHRPCRGIDHEDAIHSSISEVGSKDACWSVDETVKPESIKPPDSRFAVDYLDHYVDDPAETYIKSDGKPAVELSFFGLSLTGAKRMASR